MSESQKLILIGDTRIGKTLVLRHLCTEDAASLPVQSPTPTIFDKYVYKNLEVYDTPGSAECESLRALAYRDALNTSQSGPLPAFLLCYSKTDENSIYNIVEHWVPEIHRYMGSGTVITKPKLFLLGIRHHGRFPSFQTLPEELSDEIEPKEIENISRRISASGKFEIHINPDITEDKDLRETARIFSRISRTVKGEVTYGFGQKTLRYFARMSLFRNCRSGDKSVKTSTVKKRKESVFSLGLARHVVRPRIRSNKISLAI